MNQFIRSLEELALASRLRILSERLTQDVSKIYREQNLYFESRWFLIFYQLSLKSPMAITEIAESIGVTHPAVNQIASKMLKAKIIEVSFDGGDKRKRLLSLSDNGKALLSQIRPLWEDIKNATSDLVNTDTENFLFTIERIEDAFDKKNMYNRVNEKIRRRQMQKIEILEYNPKYREHFKKINYEWLDKYFTVQPKDEKILSDPENRIIKPGGYIFFAKYGGEIAGTCALCKYDDEKYELAQFGVLDKYQGKHVGRKLALSAIEKAKSLKAKCIFLEAHHKLTRALSLCKSLGFEQTKPIKELNLKRKSFAMKLDLFH